MTSDFCDSGRRIGGCPRSARRAGRDILGPLVVAVVVFSLSAGPVRAFETPESGLRLGSAAGTAAASLLYGDPGQAPGWIDRLEVGGSVLTPGVGVSAADTADDGTAGLRTGMAGGPIGGVGVGVRIGYGFDTVTPFLRGGYRQGEAVGLAGSASDMSVGGGLSLRFGPLIGTVEGAAAPLAGESGDAYSANANLRLRF